MHKKNIHLCKKRYLVVHPQLPLVRVSRSYHVESLLPLLQLGLYSGVSLLSQSLLCSEIRDKTKVNICKKPNMYIVTYRSTVNTRSTQRAQTSLAEAHHYSHIAHCKNVEPWWRKTTPHKKKEKKFWIITCTTIWVCYHCYGVFSLIYSS